MVEVRQAVVGGLGVELFEQAGDLRVVADVAGQGPGLLEAGGSRPAMDSFKAFRGREPDTR